MAAKRGSKPAEERKRAVEMYVRSGRRSGGQSPATELFATVPAAADELEVLRNEASGFSEDTPVSSEDEREPVNATGSAFGELGAEEIDPAAVEEPSPQAAEETAAPAAPEEERYLLDAWHAEYSDAGQRALMLAQVEAAESVLEVVIGTDDRVQVTNVTAFPWRVICSLRIAAGDGSSWIGTAWLVGPRTLITAGHCVYIHDRGGWASSIEVIPGRNAADRPFGSCVTSSFRSVVGWTQRRLRTHDYGAIILPEDCAFGEQLGYFGIANLGDSALNQLTVNLSGYPGDKPPGTQWFHARRIAGVSPTVLTYDIDTAGGQSGAPVWRLRNGERHVIGIHTNGSPTGNSATRINNAVHDNIVRWREEGL